ncbi:MAG: PIN domain-containing protein [Chloroflexia bacterium]|nr:PIN domain-containing protein [Chloroflexia bacterium]
MPEACVVDTDVVSFLYKRDTRAEQFRPYLDEGTPLVSFMTVAELEQWTLSRGWGARRRQDLVAFLGRFSVVMVDRQLCRRWAEAANSARRSGWPILVADAWIAATALALDLPLVTNNRADFAGVAGLRLAPAER